MSVNSALGQQSVLVVPFSSSVCSLNTHSQSPSPAASAHTAHHTDGLTQLLLQNLQNCSNLPVGTRALYEN